MTPVLRGACDVVPLILIVATTPGSGKSYMADLASAIVRAQRCPVITAARGEEAEKRLGALILESVQIISIDVRPYRQLWAVVARGARAADLARRS
jgi:putative DNA primase/helicase